MSRAATTGSTGSAVTTTTSTIRKPRGFAALKARGEFEKVRMIASMGGRSAVALGKNHRWTSEEARLAGQKGGQNKRGRKHAEQAA